MIPPVFVSTDHATRARLLALDNHRIGLIVILADATNPPQTYYGDATLLVEEKNDTLSVRVHFLFTQPGLQIPEEISIGLEETEFKTITIDGAGLPILPTPLTRPIAACIRKYM